MAVSDQPFMINGVAIPTPSTYKYGIEDLSSQATGRTLDGVMHKDVVAIKDYYECTWKSLSWADTAILMNAIDGKKQVQFTHADPRVPNNFVTGTFYIGTRSGAALNLKDSNHAWSDITLTFTRI